MVTPKIKIDGKSHKVYGQYGDEKYAKRMIAMEYQGGMSLRKKTELGIRKLYVGKSVDPVYSDKDGYAYVVYWK